MGYKMRGLENSSIVGGGGIGNKGISISENKRQFNLKKA